MENPKANTLETADNIKNDKLILAQNIAFFRKKLNLSQTALAKQLQYSNKNISKWELGETTPDVFTVKKLATIFGISVDTLLNPIPEENKQAIKTKTIIPTKWKVYIMLLTNAALFLCSCVLFYVLKSTGFKGFNLGLIFLYNLPIISLCTFIFMCCIRKKAELISLSIFGWLLALSMHISFIDFPNIGYIYLIALAYQILVIFITKLINSGKIIKLNKILIKKLKR